MPELLGLFLERKIGNPFLGFFNTLTLLFDPFNHDFILELMKLLSFISLVYDFGHQLLNILMIPLYWLGFAWIK